jgi:hypothetical protein
VHRATVASVCHLQQEVLNDRLAVVDLSASQVDVSFRCEDTILLYLREFSMHGKRLCSDHTRQVTNSLGVFTCYCLDRTAANLLIEVCHTVE